jgi:transposase-like protein
MFAFSIVTDAKKGLSALQLQRNRSISYPTSHSMYMKMRNLMVEPIEKLDDIVEIDETYVGGKPRSSGPPANYKPKKREELDEKIEELEEKHNVEFLNPDAKKKQPAINVKRGRGTKNIPIVGIVERNGDVVAQVMRTLSAKNMREMVQKYVEEEEAVLVTDEFKSYSPLDKIIDKISIEHQKKVYSYKGVNTNTIESFWATIKRGIMGQYHHVSLKYLPDYITEFVFKWNNRNVDDMFETLVVNSMKSN